MRPYLVPISVLMVVACSGGGDGGGLTEPTTGSLEIRTATTGESPTDGYTVTLDGGEPELIGLQETVVHSGVQAGAHVVVLGGLAPGCTVAGENPRSVNVTAGETTTVDFSITCIPQVGSIQIVTTTTGPGPQSFDLLLDGASVGTIGASASRTLDRLTLGVHAVGLAGIPANCQIQGENPRAVTVESGATSSAVFAVACTVPPAETGTLRITTSTTGTDPDGFLIQIDGGPGLPIGLSGTFVQTNLAVGTHTVLLTGLAANCSVSSPNPQSAVVTNGGTVEVAFAVACSPTTGSLTVTTETTGELLDSDGYRIELDGADRGHINIVGARLFPDLGVGDHTVALTGVASNCQVLGEHPRTITVSAGVTATAAFALVCPRPEPTTGSIRVTATTTGTQPDPDGYEVRVNDGDPGAIGVNSNLTFAPLVPGQYSLELSGLADNCTVAGANPRTVSVAAGQITQVLFEITCEPPTLRWVPMQSGTTGRLHSVWGTSGSDVFALGSSEILHYDGTGWSRQYTERDPTVGWSGIWANAPDDVIAVGGHAGFDWPDYGAFLHYNGTTWSPMTPPLIQAGDETVDAGFSAVWGTSGSNVFAAGLFYSSYYLGVIAHYDGTSWSENLVADARPQFMDIHGSSARDVYAVGVLISREEEGIPPALVYHYDGSKWTTQVIQVEGLSFSGIWSHSPTNVVAVGGVFDQATQRTTGAIYHYDGAQWSPMPIPPTSGLNDVWAASTSDVYAVGREGIFHYDGQQWARVAGPSGPLFAIWGSSATDVFAVGPGGTILHGTR